LLITRKGKIEGHEAEIGAAKEEKLTAGGFFLSTAPSIAEPHGS
jgi:hypothetical protein